MPELDTYKAIERFARNNSDPSAVLGYACLKRRTELHVRAAASVAGVTLSEYLGCKRRATGSLNEMTEDQRLNMYMEMCRSVGVQLDPGTFK